MWILTVEAVTPPSDLSTIAVWTFLGVVVTTLGLLGQQALKGRNERIGTTASPPPATDAATLMELAKDVGGLQQGFKTLVDRADDSDEQSDIQDHRHESCERRGEEFLQRLARIESFLRIHHHDWTDL